MADESEDDETATDEQGEVGGASVAGNGSGKRHTLFKVCVFCAGTEPLLMNNYPINRLIADFYTKEKLVKSPDTPLEELAKSSLFSDDKGNLVVSIHQVRSCMCAAGTSVPLKGRQNLSKAGGKDSLVPRIVKWLDGEHTPLLVPDDGSQATEWKVDLRRGQLPDGQPCPVLRGRVDRWGFLLHLQVDLSNVPGVTLGHVRKLVDQAGLTGIGGFRNYHGKFVVADGGWLVTQLDPASIVRPKAPAHLMAPPAGAVVHERS